MGRSVRVVAIGTIPLSDRGMEKRKVQFFLESHMAVQADLPLCTGFQAEFVLGVRQGNRCRANDRNENQCGFGSKRHDLSLISAFPRDDIPRKTGRRTEREPFP